MSTECTLRALDAPSSETLSISRGKLFHQPVRGSVASFFTLHAVDGSFIVEHSSKTFLSIQNDNISITKDRCDASPLLLRSDLFPNSAIAFQIPPSTPTPSAVHGPTTTTTTATTVTTTIRLLAFDTENRRFQIRSYPDDHNLPTGCAFVMETRPNFFLKRPRQVVSSPPSKRMRPVSMAFGPIVDATPSSPQPHMQVEQPEDRSPSPIPQRRSSEAQTGKPHHTITTTTHVVVPPTTTITTTTNTTNTTTNTTNTTTQTEEIGRRSSGLMESASVLKQVSAELYEASEENKSMKQLLYQAEISHTAMKEKLASTEKELEETQKVRVSLEGECLAIDRALAKERNERLEYTRKTENILEKLRNELNEVKSKNEDMNRMKTELAMIDGENKRLANEIAKLNGEAVSRDCEVFELEDTKKRMQTTIDHLARSNDEMEAVLRDAGNFKQEISDLKDELEFLAAENAELKAKLTGAVAKEQTITKEAVKLSDNLEVTKDELAGALRKVQTLDAERRQLFLKTQEMENLQASLGRLRDQAEDLRRQADQNKTAKDAFERENRKLQSQVEQLMRELNDRQDKLDVAVKNLKKQEFLHDFKSKVTKRFELENNTAVVRHENLNTTVESPSFLFKATEANVSASSVRTHLQPASASASASVAVAGGSQPMVEANEEAGKLGSDGLGAAWLDAINKYPMDIKHLVERKPGTNEFVFGTKEVVCKQMGLNVTVQYAGENLLLPKFIEKYGYSEMQARRKSLRASQSFKNKPTAAVTKPALKFKLKLANRKEYLSTNGN